MKLVPHENRTPSQILKSMLLSTVSLFAFGFGTYLTIQADIGTAPWDVLSIGVSKTMGILYGNASIMISLVILVIDILMREKIGLSMIIDAIVVGKAVDFFNWLNLVPKCTSVWVAVPVMIAGLFILGYTQLAYMISSLGCGPRDTLIVGLKRRLTKIPIGVVSIGILSLATLIGWLLGGPVGVGTLICAFLSGPIMQLAFESVKFDATAVHHQPITESVRIFFKGSKQA